jgi:hypothetical protein
VHCFVCQQVVKTRGHRAGDFGSGDVYCMECRDFEGPWARRRLGETWEPPGEIWPLPGGESVLRRRPGDVTPYPWYPDPSWMGDPSLEGVVYAFGDPRVPERICYVGKTAVHLAHRYYQHINEVGRYRGPCRALPEVMRLRWLLQLAHLDLTPSVMALEYHGSGADPAILRGRETGWIALLQARGEAWASPTLKPGARLRYVLPEVRPVRRGLPMVYRQVVPDADANPPLGGAGDLATASGGRRPNAPPTSYRERRAERLAWLEQAMKDYAPRSSVAS